MHTEAVFFSPFFAILMVLACQLQRLIRVHFALRVRIDDLKRNRWLFSYFAMAFRVYVQRPRSMLLMPDFYSIVFIGELFVGIECCLFVDYSLSRNMIFKIVHLRDTIRQQQMCANGWEWLAAVHGKRIFLCMHKLEFQRQSSISTEKPAIEALPRFSERALYGPHTGTW